MSNHRPRQRTEPDTGPPVVTVRKLSDYQPQRENANRGTPRGCEMLADSLRRYGAGRSTLADKHGEMLAGSKTLEQAAAVGIERVIEVETDGHSLVVVKRTDLEADSPQARELALADNRVAAVNLDWDPAVLASLAAMPDLDLTPLWTPAELAIETAGEAGAFRFADAEDQRVRCPKCGEEFEP